MKDGMAEKMWSLAKMVFWVVFIVAGVAAAVGNGVREARGYKAKAKVNWVETVGVVATPYPHLDGLKWETGKFSLVDLGLRGDGVVVWRPRD